jgi:hypothetical protein
MANVISDMNFAGGQNRQSPERLSPGESSILQNLIPIEGSLRSIDGRTLYNQTPILANTPVKSLHRWYKTGHMVNDHTATSRQGWTLARCGSYVWVTHEVTTSATGTPGGTYITIPTNDARYMPSSGTLMVKAATPYQLSYTAKDEATGRLTCTVPANWTNSTVEMVDFRPILKTETNTDPVSFEDMNGRLYIAYGGTMKRFDGFYYMPGTVTCDGTAVVTGYNTLWASKVRPGDTIYLRIAGTFANSVGYTIKSVGGDGTITLTGNGPNTAGVKCDYIIARVHNAGIVDPHIPPTLTIDDNPAAPVTTGTYKYKYTVYTSYLFDPGESVTPSPEASISVAAGEGIKVTITPYNWGNGPRTLKVYRTAVNGSVFKLVKEVEWDRTTNPIIFTDDVADTALGADIEDRTTSGAAPNPTIPATLAKTTPTATTAISNKYEYAFTLYNSLLDLESNPSLTSSVTLTSASKHVNVTMDLTGCDVQADYVKLYRTKAGGDILKLVAQIPWTALASNITYSDDAVKDTELGDQLRYDHDAPPTGMKYICEWNGRMYAYGADNKMYFSTVASPGYWPLYEYGVIEPTFTDPTLGGFVRCGNGEPIILAIADAGSFSTSGDTGSTLLVRTATRSFIWRGRTWADHRLDDSPDGGIASHWCAANCNGIQVWLNRTTGLMMKPAGANLPESGHGKIFPLRYQWTREVTAGAVTNDYFSLCSAAYWRDFYVFTWCQSPSVVPNKMVMMHIPTGSFFEIGTASHPVNAYCLSVWDGPGDDGGLYYGDDKGYVWKLHSKTGDYTYWNPSSQEGVECVHRTGLFQAPVSPERIYDMKHTTQLKMCFDAPAEDQVIYPEIYIDGEESTRSWPAPDGDPVAKVIEAAGIGSRRYLFIERAGANGTAFSVKWTGTFTRTMNLQGMILMDDSGGKR